MEAVSIYSKFIAHNVFFDVNPATDRLTIGVLFFRLINSTEGGKSPLMKDNFCNTFA